MSSQVFMQYMCSLIVLGLIVIMLVIPPPVLSQLSEKSLETHIHVHLRVFENGHDIIIPANIGIDPLLWKNHSLDRYSGQPKFLSPLHTHATDGVIHVESTAFRRFTLYDFLSVWGIDQTKIAYVNMTADGKNDKLPDYKNYVLKNNQNLIMVIKPQNSHENFTHFIDPASGLAFQYPSDWNLTKLSSQSHKPSALRERFLYALILFPKQASFLHAPYYTPYLMIETEKLPPNNVTLDQYTMAKLPVILQSKIEIGSPKFIDIPNVNGSQNYDFSGNSARKIVLLTDLPTRGNNKITEQAMHILTLKKDKGYLISYTGIKSANTTTYTYDYSWPDAEKILKTVKIG